MHLHTYTYTYTCICAHIGTEPSRGGGLRHTKSDEVDQNYAAGEHPYIEHEYIRTYMNTHTYKYITHTQNDEVGPNYATNEKPCVEHDFTYTHIPAHSTHR
jgi:hypothetical protein